MSEQTTQETAEVVIVRTWDQQVHDGTPSDWLAEVVLDALAAAGWSVVRVEQAGWQWWDPIPGNVSGGLLADPGLLRGDSRLKPVYRVTAGEMAPGP